MKKYLLLLLLTIVGNKLNAQDFIVKKDGSVIQSKVLEVNETNIRYKKQTNLNGPTYTINISDVFAINYKNGEKDTFTNDSASPNKKMDRDNNVHIVQPDSYNDKLISMYNSPPRLNGKESTKLAQRGFAFLGVDTKSILSSDDVEINFEQDRISYLGYWHGFDAYIMTIHNKLDKPIYIDLGNTFRDSYVYYDGTKTTTISEGNESGGSINLGAIAGAVGIGGTLGTLASGVNVGGGSSGGTTTTYSTPRFKTIPPNGTVPLSEYTSTYVGGDSKTLSHSEPFSASFSKSAIPQVNIGGFKQFDKDSSPFTRQYTITYSYTENFSEVNVIKIFIYVKGICGCPGTSPWWKGNKVHSQIDKMMPQKDKYTIYGPWFVF